MSNREMSRKKVGVSTVAVSLGCNCRRPLALFRWKPKLMKSTSNIEKQDIARSTSSPSSSSSSSSVVIGVGLGRMGLAVEKESDDPYLDFRQSMLQMIMDKEIYSKDDLRDLLNCFLHLNSPYYHGVIVRAFTDIWTLLPQ